MGHKTTPAEEEIMFFGGGCTILDISETFKRKPKLVYGKLAHIARKHGVSMGDLFTGKDVTTEELLKEVKKADEKKLESGDIEIIFKHKELGRMILLISEGSMYLFLEPNEEKFIGLRYAANRYNFLKLTFVMLNIARAQAEERKLPLKITDEALKEEKIAKEVMIHQFGFLKVRNELYVLRRYSF